MIGDKILYEGDSIKGFKVRQIGDNFVKLESDPESNRAGLKTEIILRLSE